METGSILFGILPLLAFAIVDSFSGMKTALYSAIALALLEMGLTLFYFGELDYITLISVIMVIAMAIMSLKYNSDKYFKMQPAMLSLLFGSILSISFLIGRPILLEMAIKYQSALPTQIAQNIGLAYFQELLNVGTGYAGLLILIHSGLMYIAAKKWSKWAWLACRIVVFYVFLALASFLSAYHVKSIMDVA